MIDAETAADHLPGAVAGQVREAMAEYRLDPEDGSGASVVAALARSLRAGSRSEPP